MFKDQLKVLRIKHGYSQKVLADMIGVSQQLIAKYEAGVTTPNPYTITKIAGIFNVSTDSLLDVDVIYKKKKGVKIPVLGYVRAGVPIEAVEEIIDYEEIDEKIARQGEYYALKVRGDSMEPRILDGDVVIVRIQGDVDSGDLAIVLVNGDDATIKKVIKSESGITLIPYNTTKYDPLFYSNQDIKDLPVVISGKVIELRGKF